MKTKLKRKRLVNLFLFYLGFLSQPFTNHRTACSKGGGHFFNSSLPFYPLLRHLDISRAITAESSPLYIGTSWTRTGNLWFPRAIQFDKSLPWKEWVVKHVAIKLNKTNAMLSKLRHEEENFEVSLLCNIWIPFMLCFTFPGSKH